MRSKGVNAIRKLVAQFVKDLREAHAQQLQMQKQASSPAITPSVPKAAAAPATAAPIPSSPAPAPAPAPSAFPRSCSRFLSCSPSRAREVCNHCDTEELNRLPQPPSLPSPPRLLPPPSAAPW